MSPFNATCGKPQARLNSADRLGSGGNKYCHALCHFPFPNSMVLRKSSEVDGEVLTLYNGTMHR